MTKEKSFCGGNACYKRNRIHKCASCGLTMCNLCSYTSTKQPNKKFCINCSIDLAFTDEIPINIPLKSDTKND